MSGDVPSADRPSRDVPSADRPNCETPSADRPICDTPSADRPIYLDNHATTRVDPRVVAAMLPFFGEQYGNAGSTTHIYGRQARVAVDEARESIAAAIGAAGNEIVFTSGATESNNLAIRGLAERTRRRGNHLVSVVTEHKAVLDPLAHLGRRGFEVTLLPVRQAGLPDAGLVEIDELAAWLRDDTLLVSVMLANNEIGVIQPIRAIADLCHARGALLHCDATQAVGKLPVDVASLGVDLMSFSAHKTYGPRGMGALYVRRRGGPVRLESQIDGGGQEGGVRSGTANVPGIIGFAEAVRLCLTELPTEMVRLENLRNRLWHRLRAAVSDVVLNGPAIEPPHGVESGLPGSRLPGNLNCAFPLVDGEALILAIPELAVSSGSACTSAQPEPSHVLRALGLSDDLTRASLRLGLGRFNTEADVDFAAAAVGQAVGRLRTLSSMS